MYALRCGKPQHLVNDNNFQIDKVCAHPALSSLHTYLEGVYALVTPCSATAAHVLFSKYSGALPCRTSAVLSFATYIMHSVYVRLRSDDKCSTRVSSTRVYNYLHTFYLGRTNANARWRCASAWLLSARVNACFEIIGFLFPLSWARAFDAGIRILRDQFFQKSSKMETGRSSNDLMDILK